MVSWVHKLFKLGFDLIDSMSSFLFLLIALIEFLRKLSPVPLTNCINYDFQHNFLF